MLKKDSPERIKGLQKCNLKDYDTARSSFDRSIADKELEFFEDGKMNAAHNAIDRHVPSIGGKTALIWTDGSWERKYSFSDMKKLTNKFANAIRKLGVKRGEKVFLFLPRVPELYISFLGALKAGAIAGTLFSAFGPDALYDRLGDSEAVAIVTNKELKERLDKVMNKLPNLKHVMLIDGGDPEGGISYWSEMDSASEEFETEHMGKDDSAFMLYTSGTTGKPKGVIHKHHAIAHDHLTAKWVLDVHEDDIYWCTADPGWVTGIAYEILGPWSNKATQVIYAGKFSLDAWYSVIEKYKVNVWYTAPTAIRMLMQKKSETGKKYDLGSLRHLASVGEPLNPEAIRWGLKEFGLAFHDTWWQTETGGILMANYPCMDIRLGSMGKPFPGLSAAIIDDQGDELGPGKEGNLAFMPGWPSMMKEIYKKPEKYESYFMKGWYVSGDRARKDEDGYFWFIGRADDVIKTSGERVGPFEVESALLEHPAIAEAGVIGKPDEVRGEIIKAFVVLNPGYSYDKKLYDDIKNFVKQHLAGHAYPREIEVVEKLPKTRSGKIMRRMLKAKELGQEIGDVSTLSEE
ncbi:acetate--CoA ligase [Candidatus Woesearchaeota archaeon]|nr:acetate--CoA ligase [Candidatus Woesearchaeota archaeon]